MIWVIGDAERIGMDAVSDVFGTKNESQGYASKSFKKDKFLV